MLALPRDLNLVLNTFWAGSDLERYVAPSVVVVTGDLTDAKTADLSGSEQYQEEWEAYRDIVNTLTGPSGPVWLDIRGNHDNFDVPYPAHGYVVCKYWYRKYSLK